MSGEGTPGEASIAGDDRFLMYEAALLAGTADGFWQLAFGGRGDDYEKRLQHLSKEEADVLACMGRRTQFSCRGIQNARVGRRRLLMRRAVEFPARVGRLRLLMHRAVEAPMPASNAAEVFPSFAASSMRNMYCDI